MRTKEFDTLLAEWNVPVYAHADEMGYLTGQGWYPPPIRRQGRAYGAMASLYPPNPIDLASRLRQLPDSGTIPSIARPGEGRYLVHPTR